MSGTVASPTIVLFSPQQSQAFSFPATLDGSSYTVTVWWNIYTQAYYITVQQPSGAVVLCRLLTASPPTYNLNLVAGYFFTSTLVFLASTQSFVIA